MVLCHRAQFHLEITWTLLWQLSLLPPVRIRLYTPTRFILSLNLATAGSVTINSTNPLDPPLINPNLLQSTFDFLAIREAFLATRRFASAPAWKGYLLSEVVNITDDNLDEYIRNSTTTVFHPVSTARMSRKGEEWGVVDPDLRVKGVEGLRIVDASVFVSTSLRILLARWWDAEC